ncbi:uncharacterized protein LOC133879529 isoform X2 [Alnus glutinosa]|uniref:uncharacterized protein LOC133879529 isoform X2 n=1 Tax=Alnus glutinosa TaxID=3517 RepID=UPI002D76656D|nr:uncharacterized protein LOC133879529 isoform X2 [Alnus glutinosa]
MEALIFPQISSFLPFFVVHDWNQKGKKSKKKDYNFFSLGQQPLIASKGTKILSYFPHSANTRRSSLCFSLSLPLGCLATKRKEGSLSLSQVLIKWFYL